jgi:hypothetical protein
MQKAGSPSAPANPSWSPHAGHAHRQDHPRVGRQLTLRHRHNEPLRTCLAVSTTNMCGNEQSLQLSLDQLLWQCLNFYYCLLHLRDIYSSLARLHYYEGFLGLSTIHAFILCDLAC